METNEKNAYILGTERAELWRLGLQHQVWASEMRKGWEIAGFTSGHDLLDLGCGPGFATREMAYLAGNYGSVLGVDKSKLYINFLEEIKKLHALPIEMQEATFDEMQLASNSLDGMYCRWAIAWVPNPKDVLMKVRDALRPGGAMVIQEYYDWSTFQIEPFRPALTKGIGNALRSFKESDFEIDIGRKLPELLEDIGMEVISVRPMSKMATPDDLTWQWPKTFLEIYLPKLTEMGLLTKEEVENALDDLEELSQSSVATVLCPMMVEVVAVKL